jgi:hypothetical protein
MNVTTEDQSRGSTESRLQWLPKQCKVSAVVTPNSGKDGQNTFSSLLTVAVVGPSEPNAHIKCSKKSSSALS